MYLSLRDASLENIEVTIGPDGRTALRALNGDPQILLGETDRLKPLTLPRGRYWLLVKMKCLAGKIVNPVLYVDVGHGFGEVAASRFYAKRLSEDNWFFYFEAPRRIRAVRFDPTEHPSTIVLDTLALVSEATRADLCAQLSIYRLANFMPARHRNETLKALCEEFRFADLPTINDGHSDIPIAQEIFYRKYFEEHQARLYACEDGRYFFHYAGLATDDLGPVTHEVKALAFYLPQMHPISENDAWWGKGFTEWTNVSKAVARYAGHYQPRLPGELGFYDLRLPEVLQRQAELARIYGLFGFCFYYYWFSGKTLLERPLELLLANPSIETNFCVCWANENWTRRWDGLETEVLIAQNYETENAAAIFTDWLKYFRDPRYIQVDGYPLILVYRPDLIPDFATWTQTWRRLAREAGFGGLYIVSASAFRGALGSTDGLDALYEFPPHNITIPHIDPVLDWFEEGHKTHAYSYRDGVEYALETYRRRRKMPADDGADAPRIALHPGVLVGWDTEARKPGRGDVLHDATPAEFRRWMDGAFASARETLPADRRFVFVNAWNEWAEGAYLEPDRRHGYGFLTALRSVVRDYGLDPTSAIATCARHNAASPPAKSVAIFLHLFYFDLLEEFALAFEAARATLDFDLIVTVPQTWDVTRVEHVAIRLRPRKILALPNVGRDVFPFLEAARSVREDGYRIACKLHSKKSTHRIDGDAWRQNLLTGVLSPETLERMKSKCFAPGEGDFIAAPPQAFLSLNDYSRIAGNLEHFNNLVGMLRIPSGANGCFIAGTMFWFRFSAILPILDLPLREQDFGIDLGQVDGTLAHAMERIFALLIESRGGEIEPLPIVGLENNGLKAVKV